MDNREQPPPAEVAEEGATHYEVRLDPEPAIPQQPQRVDEEPAARRGPVYVDTTVREHTEQPVIPAGWRTWGNVRSNVRRIAGHAAHAAAYHAVRSPKYVALAVFWSVVGMFRLGWRFWRWAYDLEQHGERVRAADRDDVEGYMKLMREADQHRRNRLPVFLLAMAALPCLVGAWWFWAPRWVQLVTVVVLVPLLARVGRPVGQRIVSPAVVAPRFRRLNADIVLRAYYAAKLGDPDKPSQQITFGSPMARDGEGSTVLIDLPYGKGFSDAVKAREAIASGLDVAVSQVFLSRDPSSNRRHQLWVADRDPLAIPAGRTPLLKLQPTDVWKPAPLGLDQRGQRVELTLMWNSVLVGAVPRQGKSWSARLLALYAALDPYCKLTVFDGKGSPDWRKFALVADRCGFGLAMTRDGDPVEGFIDALRELRADVQDRYQRLSELPAEVCPEGKLTREIARNPRYRMPVRLVVVDEVQEYFDLGDSAKEKEIASLLVFLVKVAPAAGVIVLCATQKPGGVGSGEVGRAFTSFRDNHQVRFSLRTSSWQVSDVVLGAGAYSEGHDSSALLPTYKGVGILRGAGDDTPTVRTYLADGQDTERILTTARRMREAAGTLTGMAAGETTARTVRDPLADVIRVWSFIDRPALHWSQLAELLAEHMPDKYADATAEEISALLRTFEVPSPVVKVDGRAARGVRREHVEQATHQRQLAGNGNTATDPAHGPSDTPPAG
ncbi:cell division protein FtsK [Natronosporangium hydrolyticum]|uniref:Cell division protein FtsK n=1 Tax=Natronosporangium hydrolyticum TaxID=2811111 RepID=A0A895Y9W9_9ACTN|nr:cell division protein FtsK [Natronosporangium hydrolyticum]QSB14141.1 cell division protein FtsK [Natronosporangium hydrolyticum]